MATAQPSHLGKYEIVSVLGKGAMGVVYEGRDPKLNRTVAIKTILTGQLDDDNAKDYSARFVREAQAVARLNHPNIVQVFDFGEENNVAYIVMEFIRGKELKSYFDANQSFSLPDTVRIMGELLDALDTAHKMRIIHRDIKPANVMLDEQGRVKLTDFGVARISDADRTASERTTAGTAVGTPAYMSPEQVTGERVDHRSDLFSAGIVLYQFLTGEKPFTGAGAWTIAKKIMSEDPRMPSEINVKVPREFDNVVRRALAKAPDQRYGSAREFAEGLRQALNKDQSAVQTSPAQTTFDPDATVAKKSDAADNSGTRAALDRSGTDVRTINDAELEFWRSIKDSAEAEDFDLYIQQFPKGIYADLARSKIRRLQRDGTDSNGLLTSQRMEIEARQAALRATEDQQQRQAAERAKQEAEEQQRRDAEARAKAQREAEEKTARETAERARAEAVEKARLQAAEQAKQQAAEKARLDAAEQVRQQAAARAQQEAAEQARQQAAQGARREAEALARKEAAAKLQQPQPATAVTPSPATSKPLSRSLMPLIIGAGVIAAIAGVSWFALKPAPAPQPTQATQPAAPVEPTPPPAAAATESIKPPDARLPAATETATPAGVRLQTDTTADAPAKAPPATEAAKAPAKPVEAARAAPPENAPRAARVTTPPPPPRPATRRAGTADEPYAAEAPAINQPLAQPPIAAYPIGPAPMQGGASPLPYGVEAAPRGMAPPPGAASANQKRPASPPAYPPAF